MLKKKVNLKLPQIFVPKGPWAIAILSVLLLFFLFLTAYTLSYSGKIYPNVTVAGTRVSGLTPAQAEMVLSENVVVPEQVAIVSQGQTTKFPLNSFFLDYDFSASAQKAYLIHRSGNIFIDLYNRLFAQIKPVNLALEVGIDEKALVEVLGAAAAGFIQEPTYPSVSAIDGKVAVDPGKPGSEVDIASASTEIVEKLSLLDSSPIYLKISPVDLSLDEKGLQEFAQRAERLLGKTLEITFEQQSFIYSEEEIFKLLSPKGQFYEKKLALFVGFLAEKHDRPSQNAAFIFEEGKVKQFEPSRPGIEVKKSQLTQQIVEAISKLEDSEDKVVSLELPVETTRPEIQTSDVNNLGIRELLGRGVSTFRGSIPNRVHNISLASSRFKGVLIAPGEIFSFNGSLGDVSAFTGYKQAFVIKDGKTVLGDGGGVCQVSTTFFRAALNSGLPIVERRAHSYRVAYYEQNSGPGLDATVYAPTTDLKILNDTPGHILIQPSVDTQTSTLTFDFYGTSDGRKATISKPIVTGVSAPPEDLYIDDPTLAAGQVKQIDFKAWGANVTFNYLVERGGEVIYEKTFVSNFRPWQAVYLRGVAAAN